MKADAAAQRRVGGQRRKDAAVLQLVPAGFGVLGQQPVAGHQLRHGVGGLPAAHETVEHAAVGQGVYRFLAPVAAHFQVAQPAGQGDAQVDVVQRHMAFIVFVLDGVAGLVVLVHPGQVLQLALLSAGQPLHRPKIQCGHALLLYPIRILRVGSRLLVFAPHSARAQASMGRLLSPPKP